MVSDSLRPHVLQPARPPCPSPTPGVYSNSCPLSRWCHLILCYPLLLLPSVFPSIRVFSNKLVLHIRWKKYSSFSISPSSEHPGLISSKMDWLDLLAVQGTLKSLCQYQSSKASILWRSAFFIVPLSHPYMTTGKVIALTRWTFVGKGMSLLFNMLSRLVITFLPRSRHLLISKNPPAMQETPVWFLGWDDPLEKGKSYHLPSRTSPWGRKELNRTEWLTTKELWVFEKKMSMQHQWKNCRGEKKRKAFGNPVFI